MCQPQPRARPEHLRVVLQRAVLLRIVVQPVVLLRLKLWLLPDLLRVLLSLLQL
ncbi:MAG: hypothetical protein Q7T21_04990 [Gallionella sp.]|nr:hypothetical protein [Gallionella sp.]